MTSHAICLWLGTVVPVCAWLTSKCVSGTAQTAGAPRQWGPTQPCMERDFHAHEREQAVLRAKVLTWSSIIPSVWGRHIFLLLPLFPALFIFFLRSNEFSVCSGLAEGHYLTPLTVRFEEKVTLHLLLSTKRFVFCLFLFGGEQGRPACQRGTPHLLPHTHTTDCSIEGVLCQSLGVAGCRTPRRSCRSQVSVILWALSLCKTSHFAQAILQITES